MNGSERTLIADLYLCMIIKFTLPTKPWKYLISSLWIVHWKHSEPVKLSTLLMIILKFQLYVHLMSIIAGWILSVIWCHMTCCWAAGAWPWTCLGVSSAMMWARSQGQSSVNSGVSLSRKASSGEKWRKSETLSKGTSF